MKKTGKINTRTKTLIYIAAAVLYLSVIFIWGVSMPKEAYGIEYSEKLLPPGWGHIFGTDDMGRDMLFRSVKGLSTSLIIAVLAAGISSAAALAAGVAAAVFGGRIDSFVNWCVDLCMGIPHLILLILISFMMGRCRKSEKNMRLI